MIADFNEMPLPFDREQFVFNKRDNPFSENSAIKVWNPAGKELGLKDLKLYRGTRHLVALVNRGVPTKNPG